MSNNNRGEKAVISSIVVSARPGEYGSVCKAIEALPWATVVTERNFKLAVVLETESTDSSAALAEKIRSIEGVAGVELVAHFFEEEVLDDTPNENNTL